MAARPIVFPPPNWINQDIVLYHGTLTKYVSAITRGIAVALGKRFTDFGPGFYTTTWLPQAQMWAAEMAATTPGTVPAVVRIEVSREKLALLDTLAFVRGDFHADDFWSLVHYCRKGARDHRRKGAKSYYDVVYGPVASFWNQKLIIANADQLSFHSKEAELVLNDPSTKRDGL
jgi:hypothetical protein